MSNKKLKSLVIPAAGMSKRFPNVRPKWMLTHPNGNMMFVESISGLDLDEFDDIYLVTLKDILDNHHGSRKGIVDNFYNKFKRQIHIVELEQQTNSQSETIYKFLEKTNITGSLLIKDSDGFFEAKNFTNNCLCYCSMVNYDLVSPENKSYIIFDEQNRVLNVAEKQIISKYFCVGGYFLENLEIFKEIYQKFKHLEEISELYVSSIINYMLLNEEIFESKCVKNFKDWGTLQDWQKYISNYNTYFIDIDGVIFENSSRYFLPKWGESKPLVDNIETIKTLYNKGTNQIILTTARTEEFRLDTINQLEKYGIKYHNILFNMQHSKRIIINDYSETNPYPSCMAVNLHRNEDKLNNFLRVK